jgi:GT2 family glycosyltransferase
MPTAVPPVVAVIVTHDPGPWFDEGLRALADCDYPSLAVLVIDSGSAEDLTPRVAAALPTAFVRRIDDNVGFAAAANEAIGSVAGAQFLLFCHDDVVVEEATLRLLVEEAYRSNAAIVGPKLVEYENPEALLEVGRSIDRYAVPHLGVEPGELDQEQHDAVRDVFYVSDALMLVRADLFTEIDGFDAATFPGGEDLDFCWRARIAGARVMVAPDARVRHRVASRERADAPNPELFVRSRVRALLKSYSFWSLLWIVPVAVVLGLAEAVAMLFTGRRKRATALVRAWAQNLGHPGALRAARRSSQAHRHVPDSELRPLQVRGSARLRAYFVGSFNAEQRLQDLSERGRAAAGRTRTGLRSARAIAWLAFAFLFLVGSRSLLVSGPAAIGQLPTWASLGGLWTAFTSGWRYAVLGARTPAPGALALISGGSTVLLGSTGLARTLLVVGAIPLGLVGCWRLALHVAGAGWPASVAALAYGLNPIARDAIAGGRLGPLVFFALCPFVISALLRCAGYVRNPPRRWRGFVGAGALVALSAAFWPPAILLPVLVLVALSIAAPLTDDGSKRLVPLLTAAGASIGVGLALLFPWPLAFLQSGHRAAAFGFAFPNAVSLSSILRFDVGPNATGAVSWVFLGAGVVVLLLGAGERLRYGARMWAIALVSFAVAWIPARFAPNATAPSIEGVLVPAAVALSVAIGLGAAAFLDEVRTRHFGWRQVVSVIAGAGLVASAIAFAVDATDGRWSMPDDGWNASLTWMRVDPSTGHFRVLWLGNPSVLPVDPFVEHGVGFGITNDGAGDTRTSLPPPSGAAGNQLAHSVDLLRTQATNRVGRLLGPMAVRYVVLPMREGPNGDRLPVPSNVVRGLEGQLDFAPIDVDPNLLVYENLAWVPAKATVAAGAATRRAPDLLRPVTVRHGKATGAVLWSQAYDGAWSASANGHTLAHSEVFGWSNAFALDHASPVSISYTQQWRRYVWLLIELGIIVGAFFLWRGRLPRRRRLVADDQP